MPKVTIDAGHGGKDPGAFRYVVEKDYVLKIALEVQKLMKQNNPFVGVLMTRSSDVFVELSKRAELSNNFSSDCFVSIHMNSNEGVPGAGFEVWHYPGSIKGNALSQNIRSHLIRYIPLPDRGIKTSSSFAVLRLPKAPAVIVECGFVNNKRDADFVKANYGTFAKAIYEGVCAYLKILPYPPKKLYRVVAKTGTYKTRIQAEKAKGVIWKAVTEVSSPKYSNIEIVEEEK